MKTYHFLKSTWKSLGVVMLIVLMAAPGWGQRVKKVGTAAAPFLRIAVGSEGTAMGSAYVSMAKDPSAIFWNPAGLAQIERLGFYVDHSPYLPGLNFNFMGFTYGGHAWGTVGIGVTALTTNRMEVTTPDQPMGTGETFTAASVAVSVSYARYLTERFSIGGTAKYVNERIYNSSASGFAFDIGTLFVTPFKGIRLGVSISNFGTQMRIRGEDLNVRVDIAPDINGNNQSVVGELKTNSFDMPLIMRVGLSWDVWQSEQSGLTLAVDGVNPNDNAQSVNVGAQLVLLNRMLKLQAGFNDLFLPDREKGLTLGMGLNIRQFKGMGLNIGYAYQSFRYLGGVSRFSIYLSL